MSLVLASKPWRRTPTTGRGTSPENLVALALPRCFHMVNRTQFKIDRVPAIRISSGLAIVVMTGYPDVEIPRSLGRGEDGEEDRDGSPIGKEVTLVVMSPWILAEGVIALHVQGVRKLVAVSSELT